MSFQFLGIPKYIAPEVYETTIEKMVEVLKREDSIQAIYRLGNVNHPGISDIDIIVVFKNGSQCQLNPMGSLDELGRYLFTHNLFAASEEQFKKVLPYSFWDNLTCIWGEALVLHSNESRFSEAEEVFYKEQVGLEFLQKNHIELSVQKKYGVIKLRSILQEIKGVRYDLDFLGVEGLRINTLMIDFLLQLDHWFDKAFDPIAFSLWLDQYHSALEDAIRYLNAQSKLVWLPSGQDLNYGRNVSIKNGDVLHCKPEGLFLPPSLLVKNKKIYNAHQRMNRFEITMRYKTEDPDGLNRKRFHAFQIHQRENKENYPHFAALLTSLASQFV